MFIDATGKSINIHAPYKSAEIKYHNLLDPMMRALVGVVEIADPVAPEDYTEATYFRTEQDTAPYVIYTKKPDSMIDADSNTKVLAQISALEAQAQLPRITRDFLMQHHVAAALQAGVDPLTDPAYAKLKALDDHIAALRAQLI